MIGIDAQHAAEKLAQVLARHPSIRVARSVTSGNVEHPIMTEHDAAAVVALGVPLDNHMFRLRIAPMRCLAVDGKARNAVRTFRLGCRAIAEHKEVTIGSIARMEGDAV